MLFWCVRLLLLMLFRNVENIKLIRRNSRKWSGTWTHTLEDKKVSLLQSIRCCCFWHIEKWMWIHFECLESSLYLSLGLPPHATLVISLKHEKQRRYSLLCFFMYILCMSTHSAYSENENKLLFWHHIHTITICLLFVSFSKFPFETNIRNGNGVKTIFSQLSTKNNHHIWNDVFSNLL